MTSSEMGARLCTDRSRSMRVIIISSTSHGAWTEVDHFESACRRTMMNACAQQWFGNDECVCSASRLPRMVHGLMYRSSNRGGNYMESNRRI